MHNTAFKTGSRDNFLIINATKRKEEEGEEETEKKVSSERRYLSYAIIVKSLFQ